MVTKSLLLVLTVTLTRAQIDGEFWWLNENLDKYRVRPPEPKFEELENWETDDSVKIVFRDDNSLSNDNSITSDKIDSKVEISPIWSKKKSGYKRKFKENIKLLKPSAKETGDTFFFTYPSKITTNTTTKNSNSNACETNYGNTNLLNNLNKTENETSTTPTNLKEQGTQSICTFIKKKQCNDKNGTVHYFGYERNQNKTEIDNNICCILPLPSTIETHDFSHIHFPDMIKIKPMKRSKRSEKNENISLNQRKFLLKQKFSITNKNKSSPTTQTKIVTPSDDYVDPYWNIKNSNFQTDNKQKVQTEKHDYYSEEYSEYAAELPRPGLIGLYSDHAKSPSSWTFTSSKGYGSNVDYDDEYDEEDTFGYSTIDPRKGDRNKKQKVKPFKLTTSSGEITYNAESATINFQSNPDFQVLRGFKLLNLVKNKSRVFTREPTREKYEDDKETSVLIDSAEEGDEFFEEDQLFGGCGKSKAVNARDRHTGPAVNGSHPWSALVVLTKRRQNILCYATLIHPRAAITVADCVDGTASKDITVIAGLWNLNDKRTSRNRVATVHVHPKYKTSEVDYNLAILYWMRPLRLSMNVQPACLGEPHADDECKFFGWGSLEDGIQPRSKWQRATIKPCDSRINKRGTQLSETFCATMSRNAVTGLGGSLICDNGGHSSIVGVVVSREDEYELAPVRQFALRSNELLKGD